MSARAERVKAALVAAGPGVVFRGVEWQRQPAQGARRLRAPCPLHGGERPNLSVDPATLSWTCHSAHCHGRDRKAADALAWVAYRAGIAPPGEALAGETFTAALAEAERLCGLAAAEPVTPPASPPRGAGGEAPAKGTRNRSARPPASPVRETWAACEAVAGTPAQAWLAHRLVWPAAALELRPLPRAVRWAPLGALPRKLGAPPAEATGAIVYGFVPPSGRPGVVALQLDALTAEGRLPAEGRWRRTLGPSRGGVMRVRGVGGDAAALAICEGPLDALALSWRADVAEARAVGGTAGLTPSAAEGWPEARPIAVESDGDARGRQAARALARKLGASRPVTLRVRQEGDPADELAARLLAAHAEALADLGEGNEGAAWEIAWARTCASWGVA